jgi:enoyl-CoA hydratase/carnithine racemase
VGDISDSGKVEYGEPYLASFHQWEPPREAAPPFRDMAKPIVCAVNGICCGAGLDLITTSDIVIASERATFFDPHVSIGIVSAREMARLARVLPFNICMRMALMGKHERMDAQRAFQLGLVSEVVEHEQLGERAREIALTVNENAPLAVRGTRLALRKSQGLPLYEAELVAEMFRERVTKTEDAVEGPRSFREKRPPEWKAQ